MNDNGSHEKQTGAKPSGLYPLGYCAHTSTVTELMPKHSQHFARLRCADCGASLKFLPDPRNAAQRNLNLTRLEKLRVLPGIDDEDRQFLDSLAETCRNGKFSPHDQEWFDAIVDDYLLAIPIDAPLSQKQVAAYRAIEDSYGSGVSQ